MGNKRNRVLRAFSATVFVVCLTLLGQAYRQSVQHRVQQEELKEMKAEGRLHIRYRAAPLYRRLPCP